MYLNKAIIIGNLTRDPELRALPSGMQVASFSLATNHVYKDKNGDKQESVEFHNVVVFGRQAETSAEYLKKGQSALIEGRIQTRSWEDQKSGEKKYRTEIIADRVQFGPKPTGAGPSKRRSEEPDDYDGLPVERPSRTAAKSSKKSAPRDEGPIDEGDINPDDIPF